MIVGRHFTGVRDEELTLVSPGPSIDRFRLMGVGPPLPPSVEENPDAARRAQYDEKAHQIGQTQKQRTTTEIVVSPIRVRVSPSTKACKSRGPWSNGDRDPTSINRPRRPCRALSGLIELADSRD